MVLAVGPTLLHPASRVIGSPSVDGFGTQWFFWFAGEVLAGRQAAGWTDLLFFPWGKDLYAHTGGNLVDAALAAPLRYGLGDVAGFDLWVLLVLVGNAWAGSRLAKAFGAPAEWGWVAGVALVLNPYVLGEIDLGRVTQAWLAPAGFALAGLMAMRSVGAAVGTGLALGLTALGYWYYGLVLGVVATLHGLWRVLFGPDRLRALALHGVAALAALALAAPFALPMLSALDAGSVPGLLAIDGTGPLAPLALRTVEGDEQGLYVVAPLAAAAGSLLDDGGLRFNPGIPALFVAHLVVSVLGALALCSGRGGPLRGPPRVQGSPKGSRSRRARDSQRPARQGPEPTQPAPGAGRQGQREGALPPATPPDDPEAPRGGGLRRWGWVPLALLLALLVASGPALVIGSDLVPNRPWIALVTAVDVLRRWWWPGRAIFVFHLLVAGMLPVLLRTLPRMARPVVGIALLLAVAVPLRREALLPVASWDAAVPPSLACLAAAPSGAVIDLPLLVDQKNLWFQTVHGKPLLGGMLLKKPAFAPAAFTALRASDPLLATLEGIGEHQYTREVAPATSEARAALAALGYRYVLARIDAFQRVRTRADGTVTTVSEWSRPRRQLLAVLGAPAVEDESLAIWTLDGAPLACGPDRPPDGGGGPAGP